MALAPGTRLGLYEIIALVGEGGMGEVYRACDTKLDRDAAIKIPPEAFAHDADRLARFQREPKRWSRRRVRRSEGLALTFGRAVMFPVVAVHRSYRSRPTDGCASRKKKEDL